MKRSSLIGLALAASVTLVSTHARAQFADSVTGYTPGTGFATDFGSGLGYTNSSSALGEPARVTPGQFGGPVDPFAPPYTRDQLLSLGAGGSLTLRFNSPIQNRAGNPYGLDFLIFSGAGFIITNGDFGGGGITDGSMFSANGGQTRVSVSADGVNFYTLNPALAPTVDGLFPTDGSGDFTRPVDPALTAGAFAGQDMAGIRALYGGSGGGAGYDLGWAMDGASNSVSLTEAGWVRIENLSGRAEIDAVVAVPEPGTWALLAVGAVTGLAAWRRKRAAR
jgi:hypothetical protein